MNRQQRFRGTFSKHTLFTFSAVALLVFTAMPWVYADQYDRQINDLRQQNSQHAAAQDALEATAQSLEQTIANLRTEIAAIESQIADTENRLQETRAAITKAEADLEAQKAILAANIRQMYLEHNVTTLEMLASSGTLSDYVDREQYRTNVQSKISSTVQTIKELQTKLENERQTVEQLLKDQSAMRTDVQTKRTKNQRLLSLNQAEQTEFDNTIRNNNKRIAELQRQQAIENARYNVGGPITNVGSDTYPWSSAPFPNSMSDPWGMYKRQCVSYTAWKVHESGRHMPYWGGRGNAKQWDDNARAAGIPVDTNPRVGDVAVSNAGTYGHVMYVEHVHGDGTITVSQYNSGWDGRYSVARRATTGLVFIHF